MTPERFAQIAAVFDAAADATGAERASVLDRLCGDDAALRSEVESLLAASPGATVQIEGAIGREAILVVEEAEPRRDDERYAVLEKLGEGGMGVVYRARDRLTGQLVALKRVLLPGYVTLACGASPKAFDDTPAASGAGPRTARGRTYDLGASPDSAAPLLLALAREFRTLASIRHPHIISVLDYGFGPTREPFFTMELLSNARPLLDAVEGRTIAQRARLLLQVLEALTCVHRRGVLHRDLKPANVLVLGDGDEAHVKVLDFGIACVRDQPHAIGVAGTLPYMAPELFTGSAPSEAADLWAVAVMAHEVLLGARPLEDQSPTGLVKALLGGAPIFAGDARLGAAIEAVLRRALARVPEGRYEDAASFARDLARAAGLPPPAETAEIRESFLSAAAFVAREAELSTLRGALHEDGAARMFNVDVEDLTYAQIHQFILSTRRLLWAPGTNDSYSNHSLGLAGHVLATASGMPFETFIRTRILSPLGLTNIVPVGTGELAFDATPHGVSDGHLVTQVLAPSANLNGLAAGGYSATAGDMVRLMLATDKQSNHPDILTASSLTLMETPPFPATVPNRALGWDYAGGKLAKGGDIGGGNAYIAKFPAGFRLGGVNVGGMTIALCANGGASSSELGALAGEVAKAAGPVLVDSSYDLF